MLRNWVVPLSMLLLCLFFSDGAFAATPGATGTGGKQITTDTIDQGGKQITFGVNNQTDNSIGGIIAGSSTGGAGKYEMFHGYIAQLIELSPDALSSFTATPSTQESGKVVRFDVVADPGLTISYDFGDGTQDTSNVNTVNHIYTNSTAVNIVFNATATVTNTDGEFTSKSIPVTITPVGITPPSGNDFDMDGVSNALEDALGSDKNVFASTPLGVIPGTSTPLTLTRVSTTLSFVPAKPNVDQISLTGKVQVPAGFSPLGSIVAIDYGGVVMQFTLDAKGKAVMLSGAPALTGVGKFGIGLSLKSGSTAISKLSTFTARVTFGNFKAKLADTNGGTGMGLTNTTVKNASKSIPICMIFNHAAYNINRTVLYTATLNKTGKAK